MITIQNCAISMIPIGVRPQRGRARGAAVLPFQRRPVPRHHQPGGVWSRGIRYFGCARKERHRASFYVIFSFVLLQIRFSLFDDVKLDFFYALFYFHFDCISIKVGIKKILAFFLDEDACASTYFCTPQREGGGGGSIPPPVAISLCRRAASKLTPVSEPMA